MHIETLTIEVEIETTTKVTRMRTRMDMVTDTEGRESDASSNE
jgi:hypothetical protein